MRKLFFFVTAAFFSLTVIAQGNSGNKGKSNGPAVAQNGSKGKSADKGNDKDKEKQDKIKQDEHDRKIWDGVSGVSGCGKASKNQPAKVRQNFQRDYPNAVGVRWTKCRGDWTATFGNGIFLSTAIYHANGDRRDTRTPVTQDNIPRRILDEIFKKRPVDTPLGDVIKIELPNVVNDLFRIKNIFQGQAQYEYYNSDGVKVQYNY